MVTLAFVGLIVLFILLDLVLVRKLETVFEIDEARPGHESRSQEAPDARQIVMPRGYFFHPGHVWARVLDDGVVSVGADDLARVAAGRIERVDLPAVGSRAEAEKRLFALGAGSHELAFHAPVSGTVTAVNERLAADPSALGDNPYCQGWLVEIEPDDGPLAELSRLNIARAAADWMKTEIGRLTALVEGRRPASAVDGLLAAAGEEKWKAFQKDFLDVKLKVPEVPAGEEA